MSNIITVSIAHEREGCPRGITVRRAPYEGVLKPGSDDDLQASFGEVADQVSLNLHGVLDDVHPDAAYQIRDIGQYDTEGVFIPPHNTQVVAFRGCQTPVTITNHGPIDHS